MNVINKFRARLIAFAGFGAAKAGYVADARSVEMKGNTTFAA
jgi:hypothetical protein